MNSFFSANNIVILAAIFGMLVLYSLYRQYEKSAEKDRPKVVKIYIGVLLFSVVLFLTLHFTVAPGLSYIIPNPSLQEALGIENDIGGK